jgi:hypothetical protein
LDLNEDGENEDDEYNHGFELTPFIKSCSFEKTRGSGYSKIETAIPF